MNDRADILRFPSSFQCSQDSGDDFEAWEALAQLLS
jgi:hypothetical protein